MFKRKKPRQNSASTSPSSSPPSQGLSGILPNELNQKILQQQASAVEKENNNNKEQKEHNSSSSSGRRERERDGNSSSASSGGKDRKKKNKHKRSPNDQPLTSRSSSSQLSPTTTSASISIAQPNSSINNSSHHNNNNTSSFSKSPSYPKKYQKANTTDKIKEREDNNEVFMGSYSGSSDDDKKESSLSQPPSPPQNSSKKTSPIISSQQPIPQPTPQPQATQQQTTTTQIPSQPIQPSPSSSQPPTSQPIYNISQENFLPLSLDNKKDKQDLTPTNEKHNNNNNNINNIQQPFSYNNSTFSYSKNKSHHGSNSNNRDGHHHNHHNKHRNEKPLHVPLWLEGQYTSKDVSSVSLNKEIELFSQWLEPNELESRIRQKIIKDLDNIVKTNWPKATVVVFGSFSSNLFIPSSDIDIQISDINEKDGSSVNRYNNFQNPIRDLYNILIKSHQGSFTNVRLISGAKVPIIKMTSSNSYYNIDICFDTPNGIENTSVVKGFLKQYKSMRTLLLILKFFLHQNNLNETYTGGIGSYGLALMVVSFLQLRYVPHHIRTQPSYCKARKEYKHAGDATDYGAMLIEFLELYGRSFNYSLHGISLENGGYYYKKDEQWGTSLTLIDPHDRDNDVGKSSFNIPFIRGVFSNSFLKLVSSDMIKDQYPRFIFPTTLSKFIEERLVEQIARERRNVVKYAKQLEDEGLLPQLVSIDNLLVKTPPITIELDDDDENDDDDEDDDEDQETTKHGKNKKNNRGISSNSSSSGEEFSESSQSQNESSDIHSSCSEYSDNESDHSHSLNSSSSSDNDSEGEQFSSKKNNNNNSNNNNTISSNINIDTNSKLRESIGFPW